MREEIGDDDDARHDLIEGETSLFEAIDRAIDAIDDAEAQIAGCKDREALFAERRRMAEKRRDFIRALIEQAMAQTETARLVRPAATVTVKDKAPVLIITEESDIPASFWRAQPPQLDRKMVTAALKEDEVVPGATLSSGGVSLQVRRK